MQHLVFKIAGMYFAVTLRQVREVFPAPEIAPAVRAPEFMAGIVRVRGHSLGVIDLGRRLGIVSPGPGTASRRHVMILKCGKVLFGALADQVLDIYTVNEADIDRSSDVSHFMMDNWVSGVARLGEKTVYILNLEEIMTVRARAA